MKFAVCFILRLDRVQIRLKEKNLYKKGGKSPMFTIEDIWKFIWSFLFVFPLVALIHEMGHAFFILLFGGKVHLALGHGKKLFKIGIVSVHQIYFLDSFIKYTKLKWGNRFTRFFVHAGGVIFNLGSVFLLNYLVHQSILNEHIFFYQFAYFSVWIATFSLVPVNYGDGKYSDGVAIYYVLRYGESKQLSK